MTRIKLTAQAIGNAVLQTTVSGVNKSLTEMRDFAKVISPTDTRVYINSFQIIPAQIQGDTVIGSLRNNSDYASGVETGFRRDKVNWHKGPPRNSGTRIFTGVGANVQLRASNEIAKTLPRNIAG